MNQPSGPRTRPKSQSYPISVEHVTKSYGGATAVDDLSFVVTPGRVTGFLGPNGAGKSTTMKIMLGLAAPTSGRSTIGGLAYAELADPTGTVGTSVESDAFHPGRSGRNHLRILADATATPLERVDEVLEMVELSAAANRNAGTYSLGMKQRLGLAAALLCDPPVLVLDEPGNGLDPQGIRTLRNLLRSRAADGNTVLVSSHLLGEVEHLADDVVIVNEGRLVTQGSLADLRQSASLVRAASPHALQAALEAAGGVVESNQPDTLVVRGLSLDEIGENAFRAGIALYELSHHTDSLEDRFFAWTGDAADRTQSNTKEDQ
ncbi:MAG: ATP-binding cassette domain-containing protein [bacterium]|nr:ATP-binding cassette domain-containing protein [bacterium]MCP4964224.1 ATP-binding cassette domain-containing protein [bacterium]